MSDTCSQTARFQIIKPIDMDWSKFGKILKILQEESMKCKNVLSQKVAEQLELQGNVDNDIQKQVYHLVKDISKYTNTGNLDTTIRSTYMSNIKSNEYKIKKHEICTPSFKKDTPIDIKGCHIEMKKEQNNFIILSNMLSRLGTKENDLKNGIISYVIKVDGKYQKAILDRCMSSEYKIGASKLVKKDKKWFLNLSYSFAKPQNISDPKKIMGVDLGIKVPAYASINLDSNYSHYIVDDRVIKNKIRYSKELSQQKKATNFHGDGSVGHGRNTRLKCYNKYSDKVTNITDTINNIWSRDIVNEAIKNNCGTIQMEDLSGYGKDYSQDKFLKHWTYYDLQNKIKHKCDAAGINLKQVNPAYTSQRCSNSSCGHISLNNRVDRDHFICEKCGLKIHADKNASLNICVDGIDDIIRSYMTDILTRWAVLNNDIQNINIEEHKIGKGDNKKIDSLYITVESKDDTKKYYRISNTYGLFVCNDSNFTNGKYVKKVIELI